MTPDELQEYLRKLDREQPLENALDKWRREAREQKERFARERAKPRNLTDAEMQRWRDYFHDLITQEPAPAGTSQGGSRKCHSSGAIR